jgi:hypothetical protein
MKTHDNVDALIALAYGEAEAESTSAIRRLFILGGVSRDSSGGRPKFTESAEQVQEQKDREEFCRRRQDDPRLRLALLRSIRNGIAESEHRANTDMSGADTATPITVEDFAGDGFVGEPIRKALPAPPPELSRYDECICGCFRFAHENSAGQCRGCHRGRQCQLFVLRGEALEQREEARQEHGLKKFSGRF